MFGNRNLDAACFLMHLMGGVIAGSFFYQAGSMLGLIVAFFAPIAGGCLCFNLELPVKILLAPLFVLMKPIFFLMEAGKRSRKPGRRR